MFFLSKTLVGVIEEMIQAGCCGAYLPSDLDWENKTDQQALEEACQNQLWMSANDASYEAGFNRAENYLTIVNV